MVTRKSSSRAASAPSSNQASDRTPARDVPGVSQVAPDLRRIVPTTDWIASTPTDQDAQLLIQNKTFAVTHFYEALNALSVHLKDVLGGTRTVLPTQLSGTVLQPDGSPASRIALTARLPQPQGVPPWTDPTVVTNDAGDFVLTVPANIPVASTDSITLTLRGANAAVDHAITVVALLPLGVIGRLPLQGTLQPLQQSVLDQLRGLLPPLPDTSQPAPAPATPPQIRLGTDDCPITFDYNTSEERFPYSILFRLVEPRTSIVTDTFVFRPRAGAQNALMIPAWNPQWVKLFPQATHSFADRVPIDQPISVDGFRDRIIGVEGSNIGDQETVPMAGTLGLGYVVHFAQKWTPAGLSLGNLVYSLPLAPGEQQKIAVFEQRETMTTLEVESLTDEEQMAFQQSNDSSTQSTFDSAFNETQRGGSSFATHADSSSFGVSASSGLIGGLLGGFGISGGGSSSNNSGNTYSWMDGAKSYASRAAETMHGATERQASSRRRQQRTSMRLASATDTESVTTKIITNNNRAHALTIQYWEVLRHFDVGTAVQGVTLVAFVPLEVVRFLPAGQPLVLPTTFGSSVDGRGEVLRRYGPLLKHADVLRKWIPWQYREGLNVLEQFAGDPRGIVEGAGSPAQDIISLSITGSFLPFESVFITVLSRRGTRLGPIKLTPESGTANTTMQAIPTQSFSQENDLLQALRGRRGAGSAGLTLFGVEIGLTAVTLSAQIFLPSSLGPNDVIGFELSRAFSSFSYQLKQDDSSDKFLEDVAAGVLLGPLAPLVVQHSQARIQGLNYSPADLERLIGGPFVWGFSASVSGVSETYANNYISESGKLLQPASPFPLPAQQVAPVLRFDQLLKIEQTLQHVMRNTVTYSKTVWMSLTAEERAIMLEGFTLGVPAGGLQDPATQSVPLLNCVGNTVLGYYGNSMIMPFSIPKAVTDATASTGDNAQAGMTTGQVQDALTAFHQRGFAPPVAHIALPTQGVLGEAVLGHCPSAEKIDLTRFWNWQDSPIPQAPDIAPVSLGKGSTLATAQAPATLGTIAPVINNIVPTGGSVGGGATGDGTDLAKALVGAQQLGDMSNITGQQALATLIGQTQASADKGRSDAMSNANTLVTTAMKEMSQIVQTGIQAFASIETGGLAGGGKGGKGGSGGGGSGGSGSGGGSGDSGSGGQ